MNVKNSNNKFKIVLSVGDESGVGPEIILQALFSNEIPKNTDFIIVGSKKNLQKTYKRLRSLGLKNLVDPNIPDPPTHEEIMEAADEDKVEEEQDG